MRAVDALVAALLPSRCVGCHLRAPGLCVSCLAAAARPAPVPSPPDVAWWVAPYSYVGVVREAVARVKYRNDRAVVPTLAAAMAASAGPCLAMHPVDIVSWVPTIVGHRRARGFDHARLLANEVGRQLGVPVQSLLRREDGQAQTGRTRAERQRDAPRFMVTTVPPARVLLVDDVVTTGATVASAASALRLAGSDTVAVVTVARTPSPLSLKRIHARADAMVGPGGAQKCV